MLVVDSSAVIAILLEEPDAPACIAALETTTSRLISAANYIEAGTVLAGRLRTGNRSEAIVDLDNFLTLFGIAIAAVDQAIARAALEARITFGRGFGTRGGLNFGDCFAYALAKHHDAPLLFIGNDFSLTDIESALAS